MGTPDKAVEDAAYNLGFQLSNLLAAGHDEEWVARSLEKSSEAVALIKRWADHLLEVKQRTAVPRPAVIQRKEHKIFLPISPALSQFVAEVGAKRDKAVPRGISPWYVDVEDDLTPFRNVLPLAYRPQPTRFSFPPIPYRAAGQNLWSIFDAPTWKSLRQTYQVGSGRRCAICGGRGGFVADKVLNEEERRHGVDCHEVWDWSTPDPASGVGLQKLSKVLVVCVSCHACFHSGYFAQRARDVGMEDEIRAFIDKRRMLINRIDEATLREQLESAKASLQNLQGIDKWVMDLSVIEQHPGLSGRLPVLNERNRSGLPPERIAGLTFETDGGHAFVAQSAREIVARLIEQNQVLDSNVVPLRLPQR